MSLNWLRAGLLAAVIAGLIVIPFADAQNIGGTGAGAVATGNVASAAADSGNPLKIGGKYSVTPPTYTDGQRGDINISPRGNLYVEVGSGTAIATTLPDNGDATAASAVFNGLKVVTRPTVFNGTTWDRLRGNTSGVNAIPTASTGAGASFLNIAAGQATTVVKASAGTLYSIVLNSAATATNTTVVYDNASGAGTVIGRPAVTTATVPTTLHFGPTGLAFANGLTIITAVANGGDMTVIYK